MSWLLKADTDTAVSGTVLGSMLYTPKNVEDAVSVLKKSTSSVVIDGSNVSVEDAVAILNAGAQALVVSNLNQYEQFTESEIPAVRLLVPEDDNSEQLIKAGEVGGIIAKSDKDAKPLEDLATSQLQTTGRLVSVYQVAFSEQDLVAKFTAQLTSDRADGLFTTVVVSPRLRVLGICYSSTESISEAIKTRTGVYQSRKRGLWYKGASSGASQKLLSVSTDCDSDAIQFVVEQTPPGFCHNNTMSCFGTLNGLDKLEETVAQRCGPDAPEKSYTKRLITEEGLLEAKIKEEADELCEANTKDEVAWEAADLLYFVSVKLAKHGISFKDVEADLDRKSLKVTRRKGDAKPKYTTSGTTAPATSSAAAPAAAPVPSASISDAIHMNVVDFSNKSGLAAALKRPAQSSNAFDMAKPIIEAVKSRGDAALLEYTAKFERAQLKTPVLSAPFPPELMDLKPELKESIDLACDNISKFHSAQLIKPLYVETSPGVRCARFSRPIAKVGLYVPGGTAILPSTAIHLGMPAKVAGCHNIVLATPPRADGTPSPEVCYVAHKIGANQIVLAGGAQAIAAMAYGTESVTKVNKIFGPGNQFVTAGKMICATDVNAQVSIDMPAGPSEVLVIADKHANKQYVASDLLSQAEHGADSQVILISVAWTAKDIDELQSELHSQAIALPRCEVVRKSIAHSSVINVPDMKTALTLSNEYAPEHLIMQIENAAKYVDEVQNAGSVFVGALSPESCGDYTSGTNHTLPTYGYANQYSGVNTDTYLKYITSQELSPEGLRNIGNATVVIAETEGLQAHANAVKVRLANLK